MTCIQHTLTSRSVGHPMRSISGCCVPRSCEVLVLLLVKPYFYRYPAGIALGEWLLMLLHVPIQALRSWTLGCKLEVRVSIQRCIRWGRCGKKMIYNRNPYATPNIDHIYPIDEAAIYSRNVGLGMRVPRISMGGFYTSKTHTQPLCWESQAPMPPPPKKQGLIKD